MTDAMGVPRVDAELRREWLALRDDARRRACAEAVVLFAFRCGLLTEERCELWMRRLDSCPGHDDEGGRDWCAFCGHMPKGAP